MVSANGYTLPPALVFSRRNFKIHTLSGTPQIYYLDDMTDELFADIMRHFDKMTSSMKDNLTLVIMGNHQSRLASEVLNITKANGLILLTIPPHTSHTDSWMVRHPEQTLSIYSVAELVGIAF